MPARKETVSAIGTAPDACDVYDMDNIFLTNEGWVYRHYKKADKSLFWDEILVAGEVVSGATIGGVANDPVDAMNDASPTFEVGDGNKDFENNGTPPAPPAEDKIIGAVTVAGDENVAGDATGIVYTVDTSNATAGDLNFQWTVQGDGAIDGSSTGATVTVDFTYNTGTSVVSVIIGSDAGDWDGNTATDALTVTVAA